MGMQYCVLIQDRFDNEAKFNLAITHDQQFRPEQVLWIAQLYTAKRWGSQPDVYRTAELDIGVDWNDIVYAPALYVLDFESSDYWPTQKQLTLARMALDSYRLFYDELARQEKIISGFVRQEMHKQYGEDTVAMRLPTFHSRASALDILVHLAR
jgi:hypothetical protein